MIKGSFKNREMNRTETQLNNFIEEISKTWKLSLEESENLKERLKQIKERTI